MSIHPACHPDLMRMHTVSPDCHIVVNQDNGKNALFYQDGVCHSFSTREEMEEFLSYNNIPKVEYSGTPTHNE